MERSVKFRVRIMELEDFKINYYWGYFINRLVMGSIMATLLKLSNMENISKIM